MDGRLRPLKFETQRLSRKPSNVPTAMRRINTCTTTTAKDDYSCFAKFAQLSSKLTIVLKERSKLNIFVPIANLHCTDRKLSYTSLFTNALMITVLTVLTLSTNSTRQREFYNNPNLLNSSYATHTANIYSRPRKLPCQDRSNLSSTLERSIILKTSLA